MTTTFKRIATKTLVLGAGRAAAIILATGIWNLAASPGLAAAAPPPAAASCFACHGEHGQGATGIPRLAGQNAGYLAHALSTFKAGTRASPVMQPIASTLDDAQIKGLADYFSQQSAPLANAGPRPPAAAVLAGRQLAEHGAGNVAACFSCHAAGGTGNGARFPAIAGQSSQYLVDRLHQFQARAKAEPAPPGSMTAVAAALDETQIAAAAAYLSQLAP